jgi:polyisoprenoid-binding protein YceI
MKIIISIKMSKILSLFLFLAFFNQSIEAQTIDNKKSIVEFEVDNMYVNTVEGTFSGFSGDVKFDIKNLDQSRIDVCIDASSVNTDNQKRDDHLRTADFFHVEKYPEICFKSTRISKSSNAYSVEGNLSMHGLTKSVKIPMTFENKLLEGRIKVNRLDYKIGEDTSTITIGEEISIVIKCQLK